MSKRAQTCPHVPTRDHICPSVPKRAQACPSVPTDTQACPQIPTFFVVSFLLNNVVKTSADRKIEYDKAIQSYLLQPYERAVAPEDVDVSIHDHDLRSSTRATTTQTTRKLRERDVTKKRKRTEAQESKRKKSKTDTLPETVNSPNGQLTGTLENGKHVRVRLLLNESDSGENDSGKDISEWIQLRDN